MTLSDSSKYCYPTPFENCVYSDFTANAVSEDVNRYKCITCPKNHSTKDLTSSV